MECSDVQFDHEIQLGSVSFVQFSFLMSLARLEFFAPRHQTSETPNLKRTAVDLLVQDKSYILKLDLSDVQITNIFDFP